MSQLHGWWHRVRVLFDRRGYDAELAREREFHLELETMQQQANGLPAAAARHAAHRDFGNRTHWHTERRALAPFSALAPVLHDVRYALRQLRRSPLLVIGVVGTFAIGLGAAGATFDLLDRAFLRLPPYLATPDRVQRVVFAGGDFQRPASSADYRTLRELTQSTTSFERFVPLWTSAELPVGTGADTRPQAVTGMGANGWALFAMRPALGRFFSEADDQPPTGAAVAVLSNDYWRSTFGASHAVIGRRLQVGARQFTIVGVAPAGFRAFARSSTPAVFIPIAAAAGIAFGDNDGGRWASEYGGGWLGIVARRREGVSLDRATAELTQAYRRIRESSLAASGRTADPNESPVTAVAAHILAERGPQRSRDGRVILWLGGVALVMLVLACANVSQLLLAHGDRRTHEFAVRSAIGVSRWRLAQQLCTEGLVLALLGGGAGAVAAAMTSGVLRRLVLGTAATVDTSPMGWRTVGVIALAATLSGLASAIAPAWRALRRPIAPGLKAGGRSGLRELALARQLLLATQAALSVVLLVGALLFVRSVRQINALALGFDVDRLVLLSPRERATQWSGDEGEALMQRLSEVAQRVPGVEAVSRVSSVPFYNSRKPFVFRANGDTLIRRTRSVQQVASPSYFRAMGTALRQGRAFTAADSRESEPVVVVSDSLAARAWPGANPLTQCVRIGADTAPCARVVGVAAAIRRDDLFDDPGLQLYVPASQADAGVGGLVVRVARDPDAMREPLRRALQPLMPGDGYLGVMPMRDPVDPQRRPWRVGATLFTALGALALLLACGGLYAIIAYEVSRRAHELAVRLAIGAGRRAIVRLVFFDTMRACLTGVVAGVGLAFLLAPQLGDQLYQVAPRDPLSFLVATSLLLGAAAVAAWLPASRAASISPALALRDT